MDAEKELEGARQNFQEAVFNVPLLCQVTLIALQQESVRPGRGSAPDTIEACTIEPQQWPGGGVGYSIDHPNGLQTWAEVFRRTTSDRNFLLRSTRTGAKRPPHFIEAGGSLTLALKSTRQMQVDAAQCFMGAWQSYVRVAYRLDAFVDQYGLFAIPR